MIQKQKTMNKYLFTLLSLFLFTTVSFAGNKIIEGKYQGKNIYVINSIAESGVGFCVYEVRVNGDVSTDEVNSTAFEIDLGIYGFKLGDPVTVEIKHKDGCTPRILNPNALKPQPTFEVTDMNIEPNGLLTWTTKNEKGEIPYIVQQFKWNKWVDVGEVLGQGKASGNSYSFQSILVSGPNKFRVIQKSSSDKVRKSPLFEINNTNPAVTYSKNSTTINFSNDTGYELFNEYGQIVKRGTGKTFDISDLPKGIYYLNYDSSFEEFKI